MELLLVTQAEEGDGMGPGMVVVVVVNHLLGGQMRVLGERCVPPRCFSYPLTLGLHTSVESSKIWHGAFCFTEWTILKE